jgi:tRNA(fMet)-specific endonuclease VapC
VRYVLDTNIVSELMKGNERALARLRAAGRTETGIPQPVIAEIAYGLERLPRSKRRKLLEQRFELLRSELPRCQWTDTVSEHFGVCKARLERDGRRIEDFDLAIVAHALADGATLVTADRGDMLRFPDLSVEDWSSAAGR